MQIAIETLGCKVNQFESAAMEDQLRAEGHEIVPFSRKADVYIVNTCTVTSKADFQSRQLVRRAMRTNPAARIIITGCYVQTAGREISDFCHVGNVCLLGNNEKSKLLDHLLPLKTDASFEIYVGAIDEVKEISPLRVMGFPRHTRAFLRIQDGCNTFCSYCIVPYARGRSRSLPVSEVIKEARKLVDNGHKEIVLTGINLGIYGKELNPRASLFDLLESLEKERLCRFRLSSIEPTEVTDEMINLVAQSEYICPHFHIPLQSGSAEILERMNRKYTPQVYLKLIEKIHEKIPNAAIGTDVMVGFPGEGDKEFIETHELISVLPISYLHVFRYSPREGTIACALPDRISPQTVAARAQRLKELGIAKRKAFYCSNVGKRTTLLIEERHKHSKLYKGLTPNYIPVLVDGTRETSISETVNIVIDRILGDQVIGVLENHLQA